MISAPESQPKHPPIPEKIDKCSILGMCSTGAPGLLYGIYNGFKVTNCTAACSAYNSQHTVDAYYVCAGKTVQCCGITAGLFAASVLAGAAAGVTIGYCLSNDSERMNFLNSLRSTTDTATGNSLSHPDSINPEEPLSGTTNRGRESVVITSQPTGSYSQVTNETQSSRSGQNPERRHNPDATAVHDVGGSDDCQISPPFCAPPSYADVMGPLPCYEKSK